MKQTKDLIYYGVWVLYWQQVYIKYDNTFSLVILVLLVISFLIRYLMSD